MDGHASFSETDRHPGHASFLKVYSEQMDTSWESNDLVAPTEVLKSIYFKQTFKTVIFYSHNEIYIFTQNKKNLSLKISLGFNASPIIFCNSKLWVNLNKYQKCFANQLFSHNFDVLIANSLLHPVVCVLSECACAYNCQKNC